MISLIVVGRLTKESLDSTRFVFNRQIIPIFNANMGVKPGLALLLLFALEFGAVAQTVYRTPTGKKYHTSGHYASSTPISLDEALKLGLTPCLVCKPTAEKVNGASDLLSAEGQTVYRTATGKKYHTSSHYPNGSAVTLSEAVKLGLGPCAICKPLAERNSSTPSNSVIRDQ